MNDITTLGIDLAKNIFQLHGVDAQGQVVLKKRITREKLPSFIANLTPCLIGMEACGGAHYWAEQFTKFGHEVKLMSPQYVKPYVMSQKNDAVDACACAQAVTRPGMRYVSVKTVEQREIQSIHRMRSHTIRALTSCMNMLRGILSEFGIVMAQGESRLRKQLIFLLEPENEALAESLKIGLRGQYEMLVRLSEEEKRLTKALDKISKRNEDYERLQSIPGIGPLTASALLSVIGKGEQFSNGRGLSAYLGIIPKQHSSGGKTRLLGITKRGDRYLRSLLIHGGRSVLLSSLRQDANGDYVKQDEHSCWVRDLLSRMPRNKVAVAIANKNARMVIALLKQEENYFDVKQAHAC